MSIPPITNKTFAQQNIPLFTTITLITITSIALVIIGALAVGGVIPSLGMTGGIGFLIGGIALFVIQLCMCSKTTFEAPSINNRLWDLSDKLQETEFFVFRDGLKRSRIAIGPKGSYCSAMLGNGNSHSHVVDPSFYLYYKFARKEVTIDELENRSLKKS